MADIFDFGFTAVDERRIRGRTESFCCGAESTEDRLHSLYNAIIPLLNNLKTKS